MCDHLHLWLQNMVVYVGIWNKRDNLPIWITDFCNLFVYDPKALHWHLFFKEIIQTHLCMALNSIKFTVTHHNKVILFCFFFSCTTLLKQPTYLFWNMYFSVSVNAIIFIEFLHFDAVKLELVDFHKVDLLMLLCRYSHVLKKIGSCVNPF